MQNGILLPSLCKYTSYCSLYKPFYPFYVSQEWKKKMDNFFVCEEKDTILKKLNNVSSQLNNVSSHSSSRGIMPLLVNNVPSHQK